MKKFQRRLHRLEMFCRGDAETMEFLDWIGVFIEVEAEFFMSHDAPPASNQGEPIPVEYTLSHGSPNKVPQYGQG